jgi:hypothetical protein
MREALDWIKGAIATRGIIEENTFYKIDNSEIKATNGKLTAGHPMETGCDVLVPGEEFEKVVQRLTGDIKITPMENAIQLRSGRFSGTIKTLNLDRWSYPGVENIDWQPIPDGLLEALAELRPFVSDNALQAWATCIALEQDWAYATNNVAIAGCLVPGMPAGMMALLPVWAVDFVLARKPGLKAWAWTEHCVAFQWHNEAWMRSVLVVGRFPERAASMVREAVHAKTTMTVTENFRQVFLEVAELAEDTILIYGDRIVSRFKQAEISADDIKCTVPKDAECSIWGASFLAPAIKVAESWSPDAWPKPAPFKSKRICGFVVGRKA